MLKILYVILSCNEYIEKRCISSEGTWLKKINKNSDYIILTSNYDKPKIHSTNTSDNYLSNSYKWIHFLKNYDFTDYEWVLSIDDDGFVFPDRLESYIREQQLDKTQNIAVGARHCEFIPLQDTIICGGGGILMSGCSIRSLQNFVINTDINQNYNVYGVHDCFLFDAFKKLNFHIINTNNPNTITGPFSPHAFKDLMHDSEFIDRAITLHYCDANDKHLLFSKYYST
jgi:hypothetical protein